MLATKFFRSLFTHTTKPRRSQTVRLGLDNLERRDVPSGTVTGALSRNGKTWTITGDDQANEINIDPTGNGSFILTGSTGLETTVSGDTDVSGVENITIKMGDGDDFMWLNMTNANSTLAGHLKIDGGNGANSAYIMGMTIGKNLFVKNGTNTSGPEDFTIIRNTSVNGKVDISNGNGNTYTGLATTTIGGSLRIMNGSGYDSNGVLATNINGNVLVRNGLPNSANQPGQTQFLNDDTTSQPSIGGNLTVSYDGGVNPDGDERDVLWDYDVQGNVAYHYNKGSGHVRFDGTDEPAKIHGNLSIKGTGEIVVKVANALHLAFTMNQGLWVGGKLTINSGAARDALLLDKLTVAGKTTIKTGAGNDTVTIVDCLLAAFNLNTSKGNDAVNFDAKDATASVTTFTGKVKVNLGLGDDEILLGNSSDPMSVAAFGDVTRIFGDHGNDTIYESNFVALNGDPITILA